MTQNTIENKTAFTALYYGQKVIKSLNEPDRIFEIGPALMQDSEWFGASLLELRAITDITDEEAIEVAKISTSYKGQPEEYKDIPCIVDNRDNERVEVFRKHARVGIYYDGRILLSTKGDAPIFSPIIQIHQLTDYLRSRSFLLPYLDLSIEQILEYGWAAIPTSYQLQNKP